MNYKEKYLKYKLKYLTAKKLYGGMEQEEPPPPVNIGIKFPPKQSSKDSPSFPTPPKDSRQKKPHRLIQKSKSLSEKVEREDETSERSMSLPEKLKIKETPPESEIDLELLDDETKKHLSKIDKLELSDDQKKEYIERNEIYIKDLEY